MKKSLFLSSLLFTLALTGQAQDILDFSNKDRLFGTFSGLGEGASILWKREGIKDELSISSKVISKATINGGYAHTQLVNASSIHLRSGEILPATISFLDNEQAIIQSEIFGELQLLKKELAKISLEPAKEKAIYIGPFSKEKWKQFPELSGRNNNIQPNGWEFTGTSWKSNGDVPLYAELELPAQSSFEFKLQWDLHPHITVAMYCDSNLADRRNLTESKNSYGQRRFPYFFGDCYCFTFSGNHLTILEHNKNKFKVVHTAQTNLINKDLREANVRIFCDTEQKIAKIHLNGEKITEWAIPDKKNIGSNKSVGFVHNNSSREIQISDIFLRKWVKRKLPKNFDTSEKDQIVLDNQQGRYNASNISIKEDNIHFTSNFGDLTSALNQLLEINFHEENHKDLTSYGSGTLMFSFYPFGKIIGRPISSSSTEITIEHEFLGSLIIQKTYIASIDPVETSPLNSP